MLLICWGGTRSCGLGGVYRFLRIGMVAFEGACEGSILVGQGFNPLFHGMEPLVKTCMFCPQNVHQEAECMRVWWWVFRRNVLVSLAWAVFLPVEYEAKIECSMMLPLCWEETPKAVESWKWWWFYGEVMILSQGLKRSLMRLLCWNLLANCGLTITFVAMCISHKGNKYRSVHLECPAWTSYIHLFVVQASYLTNDFCWPPSLVHLFHVSSLCFIRLGDKSGDDTMGKCM